MYRALFLALAIAVPASMSSSAQNASSQQASAGHAWNDSTRKELESLWIEYNQAFIDKDYPKLRQLLQTPFLSMNDRETSSMNTMDEVIESYRRAREPLDGRGYKTSKANFAQARISALAPSRVLINIPFSRYKADGTLLESGSGFYILSKSSGRWKICGNLAQDPTETGKVH